MTEIKYKIVDVSKFWCSTNKVYEGNFEYCNVIQNKLHHVPNNGNVERYIYETLPSKLAKAERIEILSSEMKLLLSEVISCVNYGEPKQTTLDIDLPDSILYSKQPCSFPFQFQNQMYFTCVDFTALLLRMAKGCSIDQVSNTVQTCVETKKNAEM